MGLLLVIFWPAQCITVSMESANSDQSSFLTTSHDLDQSTTLLDQSIISSNSIKNAGYIFGQGLNSQAVQIGNDEQTAIGKISSSGIIESVAMACASGKSLSLSQSANALGESEIETSGRDISNLAFQKAGVLSGGLTSAQSISLGDNFITSSQVSSIAGSLGYTDTAASSPEETVKATGGLNGIGTVQGQITSDGASIQGSIQANSLKSNAYSAVKSTTDYTYASSGDRLSSTIDSRADGAMQQSTGNVQTFTGIDQSTTSELIPTPGSWVWSGYGGIITSNPCLFRDGWSRKHIFAKGADNSLWDNLEGNWFSLGGNIASDPYAILDPKGKIHILVAGSDGALMDNVFDTSSTDQSQWNSRWLNLGGYITSTPDAIVDRRQNFHLDIVVKGADGALCIRDLNTLDWSGDWTYLGGSITLNPHITGDTDSFPYNFIVYARGSDGTLQAAVVPWSDNSGSYKCSWHNLGGQITSDPKPLFNHVLARGTDGSLWDHTGYYLNEEGAFVNTKWAGLGGYIIGNPEPVIDSSLIHTFVRGGDGSLWENIVDEYSFDPSSSNQWYCLGGYLTSDASALRGQYLEVVARGGDMGVWMDRTKLF